VATGMTLARRLAGVIPLLIGASVFAFLLQHAAGDPARSILGQQASQAQVDALRHQFGLDAPVLHQYWSYLRGLLHGDLGTSYYSGLPVWAMLQGRIGVTVAVLVCSLVLSLLVAVPLALVSARSPRSWADRLVGRLCLAGIVLPPFWVGILLVLLIALPTGVFPIAGYGNGFGDHLRSLVLPAVTMAIATAPVQIRTLRTSLVSSMRREYVEAARSRGVGDTGVLLRHALPNSARPLVAIVGVQAGYMLFTTVMVENTFQLPGLGSGLVLAVGQRDQPVVTGTTLTFAVLVIVISVLADALILLLDPRERAHR
jgi:peptide/nickel transport system permease protein